MSYVDHEAVAINAAGIADAFRLAQFEDHDGDNRVDDLTRTCEGWIGIVRELVHAATVMENYRSKHGNSKWGLDLPDLYDVWDSIGANLWKHLDAANCEKIVTETIGSIIAGDNVKKHRT